MFAVTKKEASFLRSQPLAHRQAVAINMSLSLLKFVNLQL
jgi:hypothetical protein